MKFTRRAFIQAIIFAPLLRLPALKQEEHLPIHGPSISRTVQLQEDGLFPLEFPAAFPESNTIITKPSIKFKTYIPFYAAIGNPTHPKKEQR